MDDATCKNVVFSLHVGSLWQLFWVGKIPLLDLPTVGSTVHLFPST